MKKNTTTKRPKPTPPKLPLLPALPPPELAYEFPFCRDAWAYTQLLWRAPELATVQPGEFFLSRRDSRLYMPVSVESALRWWAMMSRHDGTGYSAILMNAAALEIEALKKKGPR